MLGINKKNISQCHDWKFKVLVKEIEVRLLIDKGLNDQAVMKIAHISYNTLAKYKTKILRKAI